MTGELDQIDQPAPRHDDVLVQLRQAGGAKGVAELAPKRPKFFRTFLGRGNGERIRFPPGKQCLQRGRFCPHRFRSPINFDEEVRVALGHVASAAVATGGLEGVLVGDLERRRQESRCENRLDRGRRLRHVGKGSGQGCPRLGQRKEPHRDLGHHA